MCHNDDSARIVAAVVEGEVRRGKPVQKQKNGWRWKPSPAWRQPNPTCGLHAGFIPIDSYEWPVYI